MTDPCEQAARQYAEFFSRLTPKDLDRLDHFFTPGARFKDPFNDVRGIAGIRAVFEHMFQHCPAPRFDVHEIVVKGRVAYFRWRFRDRLPDQPGRFRLDVDGLSRVEFDDQGLVIEHIDFWDPAEHLYVQIPFVGWLLGQIRKRLQAG